MTPLGREAVELINKAQNILELEPTPLAASSDDTNKGLRHREMNATENPIIHISLAGINNVSFIFFCIGSLNPEGALR